MRRFLTAVIVLALTTVSGAADVTFTEKPAVIRTGQGAVVAFAVSGRTDVEVAVLDAKGNIVRHLAAGMLGGENPPPAPLAEGLSQKLAWDGKDDRGNNAEGGPFSVRVRAGVGHKLGRMIGGNPYAMGKVNSIAADAEGNVYLMCTSSGTGSFKQILALDADGNYVRTVLPFAADLSPDRVAAWAYYDDAPRPRNHNGLGPEFYTNRGLDLLRSADDKGLLLTDGGVLYRIAFDGGMAGDNWVVGKMWGKKTLPNTGKGPTFLAASPDGKYLYLSGPYSANTFYGHKADPDFPPAQVYRMELGQGTMEPFVKLPTIGRPGDGRGSTWNSKHIKHPDHFTSPHGPIHDVAVDKAGRVYVCDQDNSQVAVFDAAGKGVGKIDVLHPDQVAVHPQTGEVYVLTRMNFGYHKYGKKLFKFAAIDKGGKQLAELDMGVDGHAWPQMVLVPGKKTVLWISGLDKGVVQFEDRGGEFVAAGDMNSRLEGERVLGNVDKLAVDYEKDLVYVSNAWSHYTRFDGLTGEGEAVKLDKGVSATDLAVGPDGHVFAQLGPSYSGPLARYDRDLKPAPYEALGTHVLSQYIYGRYHGQGGNCEKGMGVSPNGTLYVYWMFGGWVKYGVSAWGPDGKPINGNYGQIDKGHHEKGTSQGLEKAIIYPLPAAGGGVRCDSKGNIYVGVGAHVEGFPTPEMYKKDAAWLKLVGSVVRFSPAGGEYVRVGGKGGAKEPPANALKMNGPNYFVGADRAWEGLAPMSGGHVDAGTFGNIAFCVCRVPRFDIDRFDRLYLPNAVTNSVRVFDTSCNLLAEFGSYGNFDSQGPESKVPTPGIPLGWPISVGVSASHVYVGDTYNRRVVRADRTWALDQTLSIK